MARFHKGSIFLSITWLTLYVSVPLHLWFFFGGLLKLSNNPQIALFIWMIIFITLAITGLISGVKV